MSITIQLDGFIEIEAAQPAPADGTPAVPFKRTVDLFAFFGDMYAVGEELDHKGRGWEADRQRWEWLKGQGFPVTFGQACAIYASLADEVKAWKKKVPSLSKERSETPEHSDSQRGSSADDSTHRE